MKSIIWKELRENGPFSLLGLGLVSLGYVFAWKHVPVESILGTNFDLFSIIGAMLIGGALGFLQIGRELKLDHWANLIHRPMNRQQLFYGKVIAGLLLYFGATLPPFLFSAGWAAIPGHVPGPFAPGMMLAGLYNLLIGVLFYLGGLITALSPRPWYGSKSLSLAALLFLTLTAGELQITKFWLAFGGWSIVFLIFLWAARGSFLHRGGYPTDPWSLRAQVCVIYPGILLALFLFLVVALFDNHQPQPPDYQIDRSGAIRLVRYDRHGIRSVTDLNGQKILPPEGHRTFRESDFVDSFSTDLSYILSRYDDFRTSDSFFFWMKDDHHLAWFYLRHQQIAVGYSSTDQRPQSWLTPDGLRPLSDKSLTHFPANLIPIWRGSRNELWRSDDQFLWLDLENDSVHQLIHGGEAREAVGTMVDDPDGVKQAIVLSPQHFAVYEETGTARFSVPLGAEFLHHPPDQMVYDRYNQHYYLWSQPYDAQEEGNPAMFAPGRLLEYDQQGLLLQNTVLPPILDHPKKPPLPPETFAVFLPLVSLPVAYGIDWVRAECGVPGAENPALQPRGTWPQVISYSFLGSLLAMLGGFWLARTQSLPPRLQLPWQLFLFWFGLPGLATFWLARDWATRINCPNCQHPRRVDLPLCPHCQTPWPSPPADGTEIRH